MEDNTNTPSGEVVWNSDEAIQDGFSCADMARFMTIWAATFREAAVIFAQGGQVPLSAWASELFASYMAAAGDEEKAKDLPKPEIYLPAASLAIAHAVSNINPEVLSQYVSTALSSLHGIAEREPAVLKDSLVLFRVAKDETGYKVQAKAICQKDFIQSLSDKPEVADKISKIESQLPSDPQSN